VGAAAPTTPLSAALGFSCRRLATAGNEALGRWELPPPLPCFPLRSACLADGSLPRAARRLAGGAAASTPPLSAALGLSCKRLATAGNEVLGLSCRRLEAASNGTFDSLAGVGYRPHNPAFCCARRILQTARCRGQQTRPRWSRQFFRAGGRMRWQL
jgi:hypothetical protein